LINVLAPPPQPNSHNLNQTVGARMFVFVVNPFVLREGTSVR
jgi:hypothetical protein